MALDGAAAAAAAAAMGAGAFSYNRENFKFDAEMRWERFSSAREYANQQAEQYREDLRNLAALTVKKNTMWVTSATLCMALCVALYCAGRLGLHGPSPPTWIMGLWLTNNAAAFAYQAVCVFLCLHAAFRANAASVQLLTRKVRVPVPTLKQLDKARVFASEFEQQSWSDIFRVPYMSNNGAPKTDDALYESDEEAVEEDADGDEGGRARSVPVSRRGRREPTKARRSKCSSWVRSEFEGDRDVSSAGPLADTDDAPEHFELYAAAQREFYQHDVYARICIFYGFIHYIQSLCYYGLGHINVELRAFWVAYGCVFVIAVLQALILRFDIVPNNPGKRHYLPKCEFLGPLAVLPAAIGMSLDFQVEYSPAGIAACWVFIFIAYILQFVYALRMLEVILPDPKYTVNGTGERLGSSFLPDGWDKIPSSFEHVFYFVAPPSKLQPGQHDLVRAIKEGGHGAYEEAVGKAEGSSYRDGASNGTSKGSEATKRTGGTVPEIFHNKNHAEPWKVVSAIQAVLVATWPFLIIGTIVDVAIGEQALVTAPHWSRPPLTRLSKEPYETGVPLGFPWPAGARPFIPEQLAWHDEKKHAANHDLNRRLSAVEMPEGGLRGAIASLVAAVPMELPAGARVESVIWPAFFEPSMLACGADRVLAVTRHGAITELRQGGEEGFTAAPVRMTGLNGVQLIGASLADDGSALLVDRSGRILSCAAPVAGRGSWRCDKIAACPAGIRPTSAAASWAPVSDGRVLRVAFVEESSPAMAALFVLDLSAEGSSWVSLGELGVPVAEGDAGRPSLAFAGESLLAGTARGGLVRHDLRTGAELPVVGNTQELAGGGNWLGACGFGTGGEGALAHLRSRVVASASAPRLFEVVTVVQTAAETSHI